MVCAVALTGLLMPGAAADSDALDPAAGAAGRPPAAELPADLPADLPAELAEEPPLRPARDRSAELFGADCDLETTGSHVVANCHNPYPDTDLVRLHVECARWWDVDGDTVAVPVGPADHVQLSSRCWKEVGSAWVSHERG